METLLSFAFYVIVLAVCAIFVANAVVSILGVVVMSVYAAFKKLTQLFL